jgi:hypothetical protein
MHILFVCNYSPLKHFAVHFSKAHSTRIQIHWAEIDHNPFFHFLFNAIFRISIPFRNCPLLLILWSYIIYITKRRSEDAFRSRPRCCLILFLQMGIYFCGFLKLRFGRLIFIIPSMHSEGPWINLIISFYCRVSVPGVPQCFTLSFIIFYVISQTIKWDMISFSCLQLSIYTYET